MLRTMSFGTILVASLPLLVAGCGRSETASRDSAALSGAPAARTPLPGDLGSHIDGMTPQQLWDAAKNIDFIPPSGQPFPRSCAKGNCFARIRAVKDQKPGPGNISVYGTVVALLENLGSKENSGGEDRGAEAKYGFGKEPKRMYLLVAMPTDTGGWRWAVRVAEDGSTQSAPSDSTAWGSWSVCEETESTGANHPKGVKAAFYGCDAYKPGIGGMTGNTTGSTTAAKRRPNNPLDPGWLDCELGCCTAGQ